MVTTMTNSKTKLVSVHNSCHSNGHVVRPMNDHWFVLFDLKIFRRFSAIDLEIEIETGDEQEKAVDSPVFLQIFGSTTATPKLFLESKSTSFSKNNKEKFSLSTNNVGVVSWISLNEMNSEKKIDV